MRDRWLTWGIDVGVRAWFVRVLCESPRYVGVHAEMSGTWGRQSIMMTISARVPSNLATQVGLLSVDGRASTFDAVEGDEAPVVDQSRGEELCR